MKRRAFITNVAALMAAPALPAVAAPVEPILQTSCAEGLTVLEFGTQKWEQKTREQILADIKGMILAVSVASGVPEYMLLGEPR